MEIRMIYITSKKPKERGELSVVLNPIALFAIQTFLRCQRWRTYSLVTREIKAWFETKTFPYGVFPSLHLNNPTVSAGR